MKLFLAVCVIAAAGLAGYVLMKDTRGKNAMPNIEMKQELKVQQQSMPTNSEQKQVVNNQPNKETNKAMDLKIETTTQGTGDRVVNDGDTISVLYTGKLEDGTVFDASEKHDNKPFEFTVGQGMVIKGWDQGLLGAKIGEKRTLTIPSDMGYGAQGIPGTIPGGATLIFDVELVSIK